MYLNNLFVYGTLLPGLENHEKFIREYNPEVYTAKARGVMYYIPEDNYPVVLEGDGQIKGVLFVTRDLPIILPQLDEIEKYTGVESQSHLIREICDVNNLETGERVHAHMFMWPPSRAEWLRENGTLIEDGDWKKFLNSKA